MMKMIMLALGIHCNILYNIFTRELVFICLLRYIILSLFFKESYFTKQFEQIVSHLRNDIAAIVMSIIIIMIIVVIVQQKLYT